MSTRIFLIRHGATVLTAEDRFAGATDVELSDEGREQARLLAQRLKHGKDGGGLRLAARPHGRDGQLHRPAARTGSVRRDGLREISHGRWEQMTRREVDEKYPEEAAAWEEDPYTFAPEGGESGLAVTARALPVLLEIVRSHPDGGDRIVSHKATIRLLLSSLLGFDPRRYRDNLDQSPAALNIVDFKDAAHARLTLFNSTSHYSPADHPVPSMPTARLSKWWDAGKAEG